MATRTMTREIEGRDSVGLYLDEIARTPLLDAATEVELSKTIEAGLLAERLLAALGVRERFASLVGADTLPVRKPDPRPYAESVARAGGTVARSFLVGDTETDLRTARAAGVRVALVGFGPEGEGIARLGPDAMLEEFAALPGLARDWLG